MRYGGLNATDAAGRTLPVELLLRGTTILLQVNDAGRALPGHGRPVPAAGVRN